MTKGSDRVATGLAAVLIAAAVLSLMTTGCEYDSVHSLGIEPSYATVGPNTPVLILRVVSGTRDLSMPLEWRVSNPDLGSITHSSGSSAVYARTANNGENTVTVRDQYGAEGVAAVKQGAYETALPDAPEPPSPEPEPTPSPPSPEPEPEPEPQPSPQLAVAGGEPRILGVSLLSSPQMSNIRYNPRGKEESYDFVQNGQSGRVSNIQYNSIQQVTSYEMSYAGSNVRVFNIRRNTRGDTVSYDATINGQSYQYP